MERGSNTCKVAAHSSEKQEHELISTNSKRWQPESAKTTRHWQDAPTAEHLRSYIRCVGAHRLQGPKCATPGQRAAPTSRALAYGSCSPRSGVLGGDSDGL